MELIVRPRQGGKTFELIVELVRNEHAVMVVATSQERAGLRTEVHKVLRLMTIPSGKPITKMDVDAVMERILTVDSATRGGETRGKDVLIDNVEHILRALFDGNLKQVSLTYAGVMRQPKVCMVPDCGCSGLAHP